MAAIAPVRANGIRPSIVSSGGGAIECQRGERCISGMGKKDDSSSSSSSSSSDHLCEMASVIETKDMLLQRLRERLAQEDLELMDL